MTHTHTQPSPIPSGPLPYVSRRALARVDNPLPLPTSCPYCGGTPRIVSNEEIYGRKYGDWPYAVHCDECGAYVGLHPHTDVPLGTLANRDLREARKAGKASFIALQKAQDMSKSAAYHWLSKQMDISVAECHWGWFDKQQCRQAHEACNRELNGGK